MTKGIHEFITELNKWVRHNINGCIYTINNSVDHICNPIADRVDSSVDTYCIKINLYIRLKQAFNN